MEQAREASCFLAKKKKEISNLHWYVKDKAAKKVILQNKHAMVTWWIEHVSTKHQDEEIYEGQQQAAWKPMLF